MALFSRAKQRFVGKELDFVNLSNIVPEEDEDKDVRDNTKYKANQNTIPEVSLFQKENSLVNKKNRVLPDKNFGSESCIDDRAFPTSTKHTEETEKTEESKGSDGPSQDLPSLKKAHNNPNFQDLYEESNLMNEERQDFENNPLSRSFDKSRPSASTSSKPNGNDYPPLHRASSIETGSARQLEALPLKTVQATDPSTVYPTDLRFATSRTTSSTAGSKSNSSSVDNIDFEALKATSSEIGKSYSYDTWDDESASAATFDNLSLDATAVVTGDDDDDDMEAIVESLFSKARHNRTEYVLSTLRDGFDPTSRDRNGNTLLHICAQNNHRKLASAIIKMCPEVRINAENKKSYTALDFSQKYGFVSMSEWLISKGARNGGTQPVARSSSSSSVSYIR